jgi:hypothetical protein
VQLFSIISAVSNTYVKTGIKKLPEHSSTDIPEACHGKKAAEFIIFAGCIIISPDFRQTITRRLAVVNSRTEIK